MLGMDPEGNSPEQGSHKSKDVSTLGNIVKEPKDKKNKII